MAKKKGKKVDVEKKLALAAKKEAKADKAARKRINKEARIKGGDHSDDDRGGGDDGENDSDDEDMDRLLLKYKQQDASLIATAIVTDIEIPLARANATFTLTTDTTNKKAAAYLFGGEYFDGATNVVSDQLFKYELLTNRWKQIVAPHAPPPRCAHSTVYSNKCLYVFGGEFASNTSTFVHYKDVWKFDTVTQTWSEIRPTPGGTMPSARSGHAVCVYKNFMVVFGGFYEGASDATAAPRWYNDVYVLNLQTEQWLDIPQSYSKLSLKPEPRSACNAALVGDGHSLLIHGGFSKLLNKRRQQQQSSAEDKVTSLSSSLLPAASETKVHTDAWILHLKPLLSGKPPTWERWTSSLSAGQKARDNAASSSANGRSGLGAASYNKNILLFGGVVDQEMHHHKMDSVFYNDLFMFHVEKRKFIPIRINEHPNNSKAATVVSVGMVEEEDADSDDDDNNAAEDLLTDDHETGGETSGWDLDKLRQNMFAFVDGEGNTVYEKLDAKKAQESDEEKEEEKNEESEEEKEEVSKSRQQQQELSPDVIVERTEPLPRIKSCLFIHGNTLYIFGGLLEVGDREVTLDDMWRIDLKKKRYWECISPGTMQKQVWKGAVHDDDDSYYSNADGSGNKVNDDNDDELTDSDIDEAANDAKEAIGKPKVSSASCKKEIAELVERYQLEDANSTPLPDEALAEFHTRTSDYWKEKAAAGQKADAPLSSKELKREGFEMARARFDELEPIIERLMELKLQRELKKERKSDKKEKSIKSSKR